MCFYCSYSHTQGHRHSGSENTVSWNLLTHSRNRRLGVEPHGGRIIFGYTPLLSSLLNLRHQKFSSFSTNICKAFQGVLQTLFQLTSALFNTTNYLFGVCSCTAQIVIKLNRFFQPKPDESHMLRETNKFARQLVVIPLKSQQ